MLKNCLSASLVALVILSITACEMDSDATTEIGTHGFTDVVITSCTSLQCARPNQYSYSFDAIKNGVHVHGILCKLGDGSRINLSKKGEDQC